jgi:hypothetical protein
MNSNEIEPIVVWYRYEEVRYSAGVDEYDNLLPGKGRLELNLHEHRVLKTTLKGVWIELYSWASSPSNKRFVLRDARKRYACPTKDEAMTSFIARKQRQRRILKSQLEDVDDALTLAQWMSSNQQHSNPFPCFVSIA